MEDISIEIAFTSKMKRRLKAKYRRVFININELGYKINEQFLRVNDLVIIQLSEFLHFNIIPVQMTRGSANSRFATYCRRKCIFFGYL